MNSLYTAAQLQRAENQATQRGIKSALKAIISCLAIELLDKHSMPTDTVCNIIENVNEQFNSINSGYLSLDDIIYTLKNEYDIEVE